MVAAVVQSSANNNGTGATTLVLTLSASQAGEALAIQLGPRGARTIAANGVSDNINGTTGWVIPALSNPDPVGGAVPTGAYNLLGTAGVTTITVTLDASGVAGGSASRVSGVSSYIGGNIGGNGAVPVTNWTSQGTGTGVVAASACLGLGWSSAGTTGLTYTAGSGWAALSGTGLTAGSNTNAGDGDQVFFESQRFSTGGTYNATGTSTSATQNSALMLFAETAAGGGGTAFIRRGHMRRFGH